MIVELSVHYLRLQPAITIEQMFCDGVTIPLHTVCNERMYLLEMNLHGSIMNIHCINVRVHENGCHVNTINIDCLLHAS